MTDTLFLLFFKLCAIRQFLNYERIIMKESTYQEAYATAAFYGFGGRVLGECGNMGTVVLSTLSQVLQPTGSAKLL